MPKQVARAPHRTVTMALHALLLLAIVLSTCGACAGVGEERMDLRRPAGVKSTDPLAMP